MTWRHGRACGVCMLSSQARSYFSVDWLREKMERRILAHFYDCAIAEQSVVDKNFSDLTRTERVVRGLLLDGVEKGNFSALILFGDTVTEFGRAMLKAAEDEGIPVHLRGFGSGTLGRQYRSWHSKRAKKRRSRRAAETREAVDKALQMGLPIC